MASKGTGPGQGGAPQDLASIEKRLSNAGRPRNAVTAAKNQAAINAAIAGLKEKNGSGSIGGVQPPPGYVDSGVGPPPAIPGAASQGGSNMRDILARIMAGGYTRMAGSGYGSSYGGGGMGGNYGGSGR